MRVPGPDQAREVTRKVRREGVRGAAAKVAERLARRLVVDAGFAAHVRPGDLADSSALDLPEGPPVTGTARVGWVCAPAGPGSGGHTTLFRMVGEVARRGHTCVVFLYDVWGGDTARHAAAMRAAWPQLADVEFRDATDGISGVDACVASSWESAHALVRHGRGPMRRFYFIQDFEPFFHPRGSIYAAAEDSYRFGFTHLALGGAIEEMLKTEVGVGSLVVPFGCDTTTYALREALGPRDGVVFFARPDAPRRGYHLAVEAFSEFHRRRPDQEIHLFGDDAPGLPFPVTDHGKMTPSELDHLYNRTVTGLALSFTNVTLVAEEMLAAGCTPVANRSPYTRGGLDNDRLVWADATPGALADALVTLVDEDDGARRQRSELAAASVRRTWVDAQRIFGDLLEQELRA